MQTIEQIEKDLNLFKKKSDDLKNELSIQQGKKESVLDRLKKEFNIDNIDDAKKKKLQLERQQKTLEEKIREIKEKIDKKYSGIFE